MDKKTSYTIGLVINPIAGVGGKMGLKGSDTLVVSHALTGGQQNAIHRMQTAVDCLRAYTSIIQFKTVAKQMGESVLHGFKYTCVHTDNIHPYTTPKHTKQACKQFWGTCDLVVFAGGDGTARDIITDYDFKTPVIGVPAGVKIQSGVFSPTAQDAGAVIKNFILGKIKSFTDCDVMDLDENALQYNILAPRYYGYMRVPNMPDFIQNAKVRPNCDDDTYIYGIARDIQSILQSNHLYIVGPGKTTYTCLQHAGLQGSLIGVDVVDNSKIVLKDANMQQIDTYCKNRPIAGIILGCVGGQGILLGRGNQQISNDIIRKVGVKNITIVATPNKLISLKNRPFRVDTGDTDLDKSFNGYISVINGFGHKSIYPVFSR